MTRTKESILKEMIETMPFDLNPHTKTYILEAMQVYADYRVNLALDAVLADVRMSLCCKAPIDKDDDTSQYCTNCLDACESHSA
jgi:hypothetical protein